MGLAPSSGSSQRVVLVGSVRRPEMGDAIGANTCEKMHGWPPDIIRPAQPLHDRVGVEHTPARLAKRKLIRARHTPFELGPEAPEGWVQPSPSNHRGAVV